MAQKKKLLSIFSNILFFLFIFFIPFCILISPFYWNAFFQSPIFYGFSVLLYLIPVGFINHKPILKNPFFLLPFTCSFIIASLSLHYDLFCKNNILFFGCIASLFGLFRTRPPFILLEIELYLTSYFMDFFEVHKFWRILILFICPLFIPLLWFISVYSPW